MRRRGAWRVVAAPILALLAAVTAAAADFGSVSTVPAPRGERVRRAFLADLGGAGGADLVVATNREGERAGRRLHFFRRTEEGAVAFPPEPDRTLDLTADVIAVAAGDVHEDPGDEILLFFRSAVLVWRARAEKSARYEKLGDVHLLWQLPQPRSIFTWNQGVRDVTGDGLADVVVPEPGGYRILVQARPKGEASFESVSVLRMPDDPDPELFERPFVRGDDTFGIEIDLEGGGSGRPRGPFLEVSEDLPVLRFADFDGDGDDDAIAQTGTRLNVFPARGGAFASDPGVSLALPIGDERAARLDVSYRAHVADLDGDRRADYLMLAGDAQSAKKSKDPKTRILVYRQGDRRVATPADPLFGGKGLPDQLLALGGFAGGSHFTDVDGDGFPDFVVGALRLDLIDKIRASRKDTVDAELYVFRNRHGELSREPELELDIEIHAGDLDEVGGTVFARFVGDATGDGTSELLLRTKPTKIQLRMVRERKGRLSVPRRALFELAVDEDAEVDVGHGAAGVPELLVLEDARVLHVRFR